MLIEGIALGTMTFAGFSVTYSRLPEKVKLFAQKHPLLTDVIMVAFFYEIMGMTVIAHIACAAMTGLTMASLHMLQHKEDFEIVWDAIDYVKGWIRDGVDKLKELNSAYKANRINQMQIAA